MDPLKLRHTVRSGPERKVLVDIVRMLTLKGWFCVKTHGSQFQAGLPDLFVTHKHYRQRWIEVKDPERRGQPFTPAQLEMFPKLSAFGAPVWVLTGATDADYQKLFEPENWYQYLDVMRK